MRRFILWLVALALVCGGTAVQAQKPKGERLQGARGSKGETNAFGNLPWAVVPVSVAKLNTALPLFKAEGGGAGNPMERLGQAGMTKQEYIALKSALMVARLDAGQPARLQGVAGAQLQIRQANVALYNANKGRLDPVLTKLTPDAGCGLCTPGATPSNGRR